MPIPRLHLFELEDLRWFPTVVRDLATDYLHFMEHRLQLHRPVVPLLKHLLVEAQCRDVIDLCSGGAGAVPALHNALAAEGISTRFTLTDLYPNIEAFERAAFRSGGAISFVRESVDARDVPRSLAGARTMFNSFHHFRPSAARAIIRDAVHAKQPVAIFEIPERSLPMAPFFLITPLFVWGTTPLIRPFRWRRLFWTYLIPLVPLTCLWDGIVSQLRAYTVAELEELANEFSGSGYVWSAGKVPVPSSKASLTYLMGYPSTGTRSAG